MYNSDPTTCPSKGEPELLKDTFCKEPNDGTKVNVFPTQPCWIKWQCTYIAMMGCIKTQKQSVGGTHDTYKTEDCDIAWKAGRSKARICSCWAFASQGTIPRAGCVQVA